MAKGIHERIREFWEEKTHERRSFSLTEKGKEYDPSKLFTENLASFGVSIRDRKIRVSLCLDTETITGANVYSEILELLEENYSFKIGQRSSNKKRVCEGCEAVYYSTKSQPPYTCTVCGHKQRK